MKVNKKFIWITALFFVLAASLWLGRDSIIRYLFYPRMAKPYQSAFQTLRSLGTAESEFYHRFGRYGTLPELAEKGLVPAAWATGKVTAYQFDIQLKGIEYEAFASPQKYSTDTNLSFYLASLDWRIRGADKQGQPADIHDPIFE
jgi:hypothetical protein